VQKNNPNEPKLALVQIIFMPFGQETDWAYSIVTPGPTRANCGDGQVQSVIIT